MSEIDKIDLELAKYEEVLRKLKTDLVTKIKNLPDNPRIMRVGGNPHCFVMRSAKHPVEC